MMKNKEIEADRVARGLRVSQIRERQKVSKSEFSRLSGISRPLINAIESGFPAYKIDTWIRYLQALKDIIQSREVVKCE